MKESIHIKKLGPIIDVHIVDIKPFTVFIGDSGSGKSTLMKALSLFRWISKMDNIRSYLKHSKISKSPFKFRMGTYIKNCGFEGAITSETEIIYTTTFDSGNVYELKFVNNKLSTGNLIHPDDIYFKKISFIAETRNIIPLWIEKGARFPGADLGFYFKEVYEDFDRATESVKELSLSFLGIKFSVKKTQQGKKYIIEPAEKRSYQIDFKNSSSGTQSSIPISLICEYFNKHFSFIDAFNRSAFRGLSEADKLTDFKAVKDLSDMGKKIYIHIEEPELSLYPDAQRSLINDMICKCLVENKTNIEIVFSTHSPYIINHINLLIKAYDKKKLVEGASLNFEDIAVYEIVDGGFQDLKLINKKLIDTNALSETINEIYSEYSELDKQ